jgi:crossover junction endodeoxyribonuclease RuvC
MALMGFGVVEQCGNRLHSVAFGVVTSPKDMAVHFRLEVVFSRVTEILEQYRPDAAAVESLFFNVNVRTALAVGQARGVALLACARAGCGLFEYTPQQVKQGVVGYGKAEKRQVQEMVKVLLGLAEAPRPDDVADALGVAICHAHSTSMLDSIDAALRRERSAGR